MKLLIIGALPKNEQEKEIYNILIGASKEKEIIGTPIDTLNFNGNDAERYKRAFDLIEKANVIIAEASYPSTGQGMELNEAIRLNKKIIVIAKKDSKVSGLILGCPSIKDIIYYDSLDDLKEKIKEIL